MEYKVQFWDGETWQTFITVSIGAVKFALELLESFGERLIRAIPSVETSYSVI